MSEWHCKGALMQLVQPPASPPPFWPNLGATSIGYAEIVHRAYAGDDLSALTRELVAQASGPVRDAGALLDLATVLQLQGGDLAVEGKLMQLNALHLQRTYVIRHGSGLGPRVLAFVTAGDFMANTPLDFLLRGSDAVLILHFVDAATQSLADLPEHDLAFMAIGEAPENAAVLQVMAQLLQGWQGPVFNRDVVKIAQLDRVSVSEMLADEASIYAPLTKRMSRNDLIALAKGVVEFPLLLRPIGSHAGAGLCQITDRAALVDWLRSTSEADAFVAPFVDYRGADGLYSKARVVQICGTPFASHLARSKHWMVHYLNADMTQNADRRAAEADWMAGFDQDFALRHAKAFAALYRIIGLEYFGIDCAELPDGRLLVFEVDVAMIVHDMDDAGVFPYKKPVMQKLFAGFLAAINAA
jgi:glutathione synthase/RimK-type ligase-like ATP-grasp enzyme